MTDTKTTTSKTSLSTWKANKVHTVTLPSDSTIQIALPNLAEMLKAGQVPNHLVEVAVQYAGGNVQVTEEMLKDQADFLRFLVAKTVHAPEISEADVVDLPYEDTEMIVDFAMRSRDVDALGHQLAGLEKSADWRKFRGIEDSAPSGFGG